MSNKQDIPQGLQKTFDRLLELVPVPYRYEKNVQGNILKYLKLKGEEFVRQSIDRTLKIFAEKSNNGKTEK